MARMLQYLQEKILPAPTRHPPFCAVRPRRELFKLFWIPDLDNPFKRTQLVTNTPE